ncbi:MAG: selenide, water dikinase SelD [Deltaproteobacteria bacterium]|nr:selenide, water dikinase SelD [Deltaproteobacteria bacterium]
MGPDSPTVPAGWFSNCASGGCGAKIGPSDLASLLVNLPRSRDKNLLVGYDSADDAAVYQINPGKAFVSTADFFPPMVEDPFIFGQAAAANALSDVYAMGGKPLTALNLVCFPQSLDMKVLGLILRGGAEKVLEAGASICGGHSIYDHEPKYGLCVTGIVNPGSIWRNSGASPGEVIILTKALGVGLVLSARRVGEVSTSEYDAACASMTRLNRYAAENLSNFSVSAATDITGFGLAGHLSEMAGDNLTITIDYDSLPILPGALRCAEEFLATSGGQRNRTQLAGRVDLSSLSPAQEEIIYDPQTSGGLAVSLPAREANNAVEILRSFDPASAIIGQVDIRRDQMAVVVL